MKYIVKKTSIIFILVLAIILSINLNVNATNIATMMGFDIPSEMEVIHESDQKNYTVQYNKNYWTAHNKGLHDCADFSTWQGAYQYYDDEHDTLYIFLASFCNTYPYDKEISVARNARVRNKAIYQEIFIEQPTLNGSQVPIIGVGYSPKNENGSWSETIGFTYDSENGYWTPNYSITEDHKDVEWVVKCDNSKKISVSYNYTRYTSCNDGVYVGSNTHMASFYFCIKNAQSYDGKNLTFYWDYRAEYYIDDAGWENYSTSTSNEVNKKLKLKQNYSYNIKL
ncbi:MAG: hypothetical protein NC087_01675 [Anaeroplasma bactoclasticum]|nr:hypothetical protein [Anaeroplasma bactoclasticum]MCM1556223.1 hypothetical protein [Anaeroplasma bactoclasticum]